MVKGTKGCPKGGTMTSTQCIDNEKWARFRFSVIGGLLARPMQRGELKPAIEALAEKSWIHPTQSDQVLQLGFSTIERWLYRALKAANPFEALGRRTCQASRGHPSLGPELFASLQESYRLHRGWTYKLHYENLLALVEERSELGPLPAYHTVRRTMKRLGWYRDRKRFRNPTPGQQRAMDRLDTREVRSYEATHVHQLWHTDFHSGSLPIQTPKGTCVYPRLCAVLDDASRLCCHAQWYLAESAENFYHALAQAFFKRGIPKSLMSDNGGAFTAEEITEGLARIGVVHELILPYSPYQNGKQEHFWAVVESQLLPMLELVKPLTLDFLNKATQAWVEESYNRTVHASLGMSPLERLIKGPELSREAPDAASLRFAFTLRQERILRRSDCTCSVEGVRFEVPFRFKELRTLTLRYQRWNLADVLLVDQRTSKILARLDPLDKKANAGGMRRTRRPLLPPSPDAADRQQGEPLPPLMRRLLADYAATGLPPAYIPKDELHLDIEGDAP
jgi:transposase InsO family protein